MLNWSSQEIGFYVTKRISPSSELPPFVLNDSTPTMHRGAAPLRGFGGSREGYLHGVL